MSEPMAKIQFEGHEYVLKSAYERVCKERDEALEANRAFFDQGVRIIQLEQQLAAERARADKAEVDHANNCLAWNEAIEKVEQERDRAQAEVERLNAILASHKLYEDYQAEIDRLRSALEQIATSRCAWQLSQKIAHEALKEGGE